ncbi:hypothetical protein HUJ04_000097 [Dendroctonus ponderosae]|nr:hypothetical protein HUJ04_000097 [Dendroctonus ponderosae]
MPARTGGFIPAGRRRLQKAPPSNGARFAAFSAPRAARIGANERRATLPKPASLVKDARSRPPLRSAVVLKGSLPIIGAKRQIVFALIVGQPAAQTHRAVNEKPISDKRDRPSDGWRVETRPTPQQFDCLMADHHGDQDVEAITAQRRLDCYQNVSQATPPSAVFCPVLFDGWSCWPVTEAGMTANQSCPDFIPGFERANTVSYKCEQDGSWYFHEAYNKTWVNYTSCVNTADLSFRTIVVSIHCFGYGVSLIALLVSLALLFHFKSLRCVRILIHMNLFASFALNNCLWLLWYYVVFDETAILISNEVSQGAHPPQCPERLEQPQFFTG